MVRVVAIVACCGFWVGCAGSQSQTEVSGQERVIQTRTPGNLSVIRRRGVELPEHQALVVTAGGEQSGPAACEPMPVFFDKDSAELDALAKETLNRKLDECLKARDLNAAEPITLDIEAHEHPDVGWPPKEMSDDGMAVKRAAAVADYLRKQGFDMSRYKVVEEK